MPTIYGQNTSFDTARTVVKNALDALKAAMISGSVTPRFDAVYNTHWTEPAVDFPAVSISIDPIDAIPLGNRVEFMYRVKLRILTGDANSFKDEVTFLQLANSVLNWFFEHISTLGSGFVVKKDAGVGAKVTPNLVFDDVRAIGGTVEFTIFGIEVYTQV
jgi:hypothetical protein